MATALDCYQVVNGKLIAKYGDGGLGFKDMLHCGNHPILTPDILEVDNFRIAVFPEFLYLALLVGVILPRSSLDVVVFLLW